MSCGIYKIENVANGRVYIGSSVNIPRRLFTHKWNLKRSTHSNQALQNAWDTYGEDCFTFKSLLICDKSNLLFYEQLCIDAYKAHIKPYGYNIRKKAESNHGLPGRRKYHVGMTFGKLILLEHIDRIRSRFKCFCGKDFITGRDNVVRGGTTSCGCFRKAHFSRIRTIHKVGDKYGEWTLIKLHTRRPDQSNLWVCKCSCGVEKVVDVHSVKSGHSKSCGCKKGESISMKKGKLVNIDGKLMSLTKADEFVGTYHGAISSFAKRRKWTYQQSADYLLSKHNKA